MVTVLITEIEQLGLTKAEFDARVAAFSVAKEAHKLTVDVPAPAEIALIESIYNDGEYFVDESAVLEKSEAQELAQKLIDKGLLSVADFADTKLKDKVK